MYIDRCPYEDLPPLKLELCLVHSDNPPFALLYLRRHVLQGADPIVYRHVARAYQPRLVCHPSVGESTHVEQAGNYVSRRTERLGERGNDWDTLVRIRCMLLTEAKFY